MQDFFFFFKWMQSIVSQMVKLKWLKGSSSSTCSGPAPCLLSWASAPQKNGNTDSIWWVCIPHQHSFGDAELNPCQDIWPTSLGISHHPHRSGRISNVKCLYTQLQAVEHKITNCCAFIQDIQMWVCKTGNSPYTYHCFHVILQVRLGCISAQQTCGVPGIVSVILTVT